MIRRKTFAYALTVAAVSLMVICAAIAKEEETRSAKELLDDAVRLYKVKKYEASLNLLEKVERDDLGWLDKGRFDNYLSKVKNSIEQSKMAKVAMEDGEQALKDKKYATAIENLEKACKSSYLDKTLQNKAEALLSAARDGEKIAIKKAKELMAKAEEELKAGQFHKARKTVDEIHSLDVRLGFFDRQKLDRITKKLPKTAAKEKEPAEEKPAPESTAEEPAVTTEKPAPEAVEIVEPEAVEPKEVEPAEVEPAEIQPPKVEPVVKPIEEPAVEKEPPVSVREQARRARAMALTEQAQQAQQNFDLRDAQNRYREALELWPEYEPAKQGLKEVERALAAATGQPLIKDVAGPQQIERQRVNALLNELYTKAQREYNRERYDEAKKIMAGAELSIKEARILTPEEAEDWREKFHALRTSVEAAEKLAQEKLSERRAKEALQAKAEREERDRKAREEKAKQLWESVQALRKTYQYRRAIEVLDTLLEIDPENERAQRWKEDMLYLESQLRQVGLREETRREMVEALTDAKEIGVAPGERLGGKVAYVRFPETKEWKDLVETHQKFLAKEAVWAESPATIAMREKLHQRIDVDMVEKLALRGFIDLIKDKYKEATGTTLNIMIDEPVILQALDKPDISDVEASPVRLEGISVERVLQLALPAEISYDVKPDLVLITTREKLQENLPARSYGVRDLIATIPDHAGQAPTFDVQSVTEAAAERGGGAAAFWEPPARRAEEEEGGIDALKELIMRTVNEGVDREVAKWERDGGRATIEDIRGVLVITQTLKGHELIRDLLDQLRAQRAVMVSVEARFVTVSDDFLQDITLDVDLVFMNEPWGGTVSDPADVIAGGAWDTLPGASRPIIISSTTSNGMGTSTLLPLSGSAFSAFDANEGGIAIGGVFLDQIQLGFLLRAIQADKRSTVVWAPRVTMYDGQRAFITVTTQYLYVSDMTPVVAAGEGAAAEMYDPTIGAIPVGTTLDVRATVSADRKYVQLDLYPQVISIEDWESFTLSQNILLDLPQINVQEVRTTVSVPDGGTLLLGGLKKLTEVDVESGAPVLSKVPGLKQLFSNRAALSVQSNLLILITPRIIIQAEEEARQTGL